MIQQINEELFRRGYQFVKATPPEAGIYYKVEGKQVVILVAVFYHQGFQLTPFQAKTMQKKVRDLFLYSGRIPNLTETEHLQVEELMLLVADHMDGIREICSENSNTWALDSHTGNLILYENQPSEFHGLRGYLESLSTAGVGESASEYGPYARTDRQYDQANGSYTQSDRQYDREKSAQVIRREKRGWKTQPIVTIGIVAVNIIVWLILELLGDTREGMFMFFHGAMYPDCLLGDGQWWRLITAMFLHFGLEHLLNNMVILAVTGHRLENALGHVRFAVLYLFSGIAGNIFSYMIMERTEEYAISAGASGAVFGVIGGLLFVAIKNKGHIGDLRAKGLMLMIALCLYYGFTAESVDNWCHIGGLVSGFVLGMIVSIGRKTNRKKTSGKD